MKYAIIRTGGKQYKINEGDIIDVERLADSANNKSVIFSEVLMTNTEGDVKLGAPLLTDVTVKGTVVEDLRGEKIRIAKFKAKSRYRKVTGHRQALTRVKIESISLSGSKAKTTAEAEKAEVSQKPARKTVKKTQ